MRVGVVGGGFTGLTVAYELLKRGYLVTLLESQGFFGGLAASYEILPGLFVERFYHHLFTNDFEILDLCRQIGVSQNLRVLDGKTSHYYQGRIYPLDSPLAVMRFGPLNFLDRLRFGLVTLALKLSGPWPWFEKVTATVWLKKFYGGKIFQIIWRPLLRGKFANYYDKISMIWFWARVKKRTPKLIYPRGGFQTIIQALIAAIESRGGQLKSSQSLAEVVGLPGGGWRVKASEKTYEFEKLVVTTSLKIFLKLIPSLPEPYRTKVDSINYINAQMLILVLSQRLSRHYWINIGDLSFPFLVVGEQGNLLEAEADQGKSIVYLGNYLPGDDPRLGLSSAELLSLYEPFLKKLNPNFDKSWVEKAEKFVGAFAQPIVDLGYKDKMPSFRVPGFDDLFLATMAQVYPWDRGTNYAVKLGQDLVKQCF